MELNREQERAAQRQTSGFKPERKRYRLRFEGTENDGLVVELSGLSVGTFLEVAEMADLDPKNFGIEDLPKVRRLFEVVAGALVSWNLLDDDGEPVPATYAGIMGQDFPLVMAIVDGWMEAVGGVADPLVPTSAVGKLSAVASLPMDVESPSPDP